MDLVVDANVLFAALIKESFSYQLLFNNNLHLFSPEYLFIELEKHKEELIDKTERTTEEFYRVLEIMKRKITLIHLEELVDHIEEAEKITPDPDDLVYFALALKLRCAIWSNDKELREKQEVVKIYPTHELLKFSL
ncbi:MAG: PIN domain-containing protein [Candidatus Woesearchaeota archaeon]